MASVTAETGTIKLEGSAVVEGPELRIDYKLQNTGRNKIYVWDRLDNTDGREAVIDDRLAYVCWHDPKSVRVTRAFLQLPLEFEVWTKSEPYVTPVLPGDFCEGKIRLTDPVLEYNPYYPPPEDTQLVRATSVLLVIGWIEHKDDMKLVPREVGGLKVNALRGSWTAPHQKLATATYACPVSVLRYKSQFDRRMPLE